MKECINFLFSCFGGTGDRQNKSGYEMAQLIVIKVIVYIENYFADTGCGERIPSEDIYDDSARFSPFRETDDLFSFLDVSLFPETVSYKVKLKREI